MSWKETFVMYRPSPDGKLVPVYETSDFKQAQYWMKYIAVAGDVGCRTPNHPKHTKGTEFAEYWCHKEQSGSFATDEKSWHSIITGMNCKPEFPNAAESRPAAS